MAWVFGYFRASWTLRADLVADFVCRLLNHMKEKGARKVTPTLRPEDQDMPLLPWIDPENFNPGYMMRGMHLLPKRGDKPEWQHTQDYWTEKDAVPRHRPRRRLFRLRVASEIGLSAALIRQTWQHVPGVTQCARLRREWPLSSRLLNCILSAAARRL